MARKGLTQEKIIDEAIYLIKERGYKEFSMRTLAEQLDVKPASMYNHFKSLEDVVIAVGLKIYERFNAVQEEAINNARTRKEAVMALALAYRQFAFENPELYKVIRVLPKLGGEQLTEIVQEWIKPMKQVMSLYHIDNEKQMHWQRIYRATITGFLSNEISGQFVWNPVSPEESYRLAIMNIIAALESMEREEKTRAAFLNSVLDEKE